MRVFEQPDWSGDNSLCILNRAYLHYSTQPNGGNAETDAQKCKTMRMSNLHSHANMCTTAASVSERTVLLAMSAVCFLFKKTRPPFHRLLLLLLFTYVARNRPSTRPRAPTYPLHIYPEQMKNKTTALVHTHRTHKRTRTQPIRCMCADTDV